MWQDEIRRRLERLNNGDRRVEDVTQTFQFIREFARSQKTVLEVAHSFAHRRERDRGLITEEAQVVYDSLSGYMLMKQNEALEQIGLPIHSELNERFFSRIDANLRIIPPKTLSNALNMTAKRVRQLALSGKAKYDAIEGGYQPRELLTFEEANVLMYLARTFYAHCPFNASSLISEVNQLIKAHVSDSVTLTRKDAQDFLILCVLSVLHNTYIKLPHGPRVILMLNAGFPNKEQMLKLDCSLYLKLPPLVGHATLVLPFFSTDLSAGNYVDVEYLCSPQNEDPGPLEACSDLKLRPIGT